MDLTRVTDVISVGYIANIMQCARKLITSCGCKIALELFLVVLQSLDTTQDNYWYSDTQTLCKYMLSYMSKKGEQSMLTILNSFNLASGFQS